jgi:serine/threonine protein kinase
MEAPEISHHLPKNVGPYQISGVLSQGGVGVVYQATHPRRSDPVALKLLHLDLAHDPEWVQRFEREIEVIQQFSHPNLVAYLDHGWAGDGRPFVVMPLLKGDNLRTFLDDHKNNIPVQQAWELLRPIAHVLQKVHEHGYIHRDIKPENILLAQGDSGTITPQLLDLGLAKTITPDKQRQLTQSGSPLGTPSYMPPEQWWGKDVNANSDQYGLAVVLFEMLCGRPPFVEDSYAGMMQAHLSKPVPRLNSLGCQVSEEIETWFQTALHKESEQRFPNMSELIAEADRLFSNTATKRTGFTGTIWLVVASAPAIMTLLGYAGTRSWLEWKTIAGWAIWPIVSSFVVIQLAWLFVPKSQQMGSGWCLIPAAFGLSGTFMGWQATLQTMSHNSKEIQFEIFNIGLTEASVQRFLGYGLSSGLLLGYYVWHSSRSTMFLPTKTRVSIFSLLLLFLGILALVAGRGSAGWVALVGAAILFLARFYPQTKQHETKLILLRILLVVSVASASLTRLAANAGSLWEKSPTRAERVREIVSIHREQNITWLMVLFVLVLLAWVSWERWKLVAHEQTQRTPMRYRLTTLGIVLLWLAADGGMQWTIRRQHLQLWNDLSPQFSMFTQLNPPQAEHLPSPSRLLTMQVTREVIAIEQEKVVPTQAIVNTQGKTVLSLDLAHRLTRFPSSLHRMALIVDRQVTWKTIEIVLQIAHALGVSKVELLFTRGPLPTHFSTDMPLEAAYALPKDFGAFELILTTEKGSTNQSQETLETMAALWKREHRFEVGKLTIHLPASQPLSIYL